MNKTIKLAVCGFLLLITIGFLWTINPLFALLMGYIGVVPFVQSIFETREYYNRNAYLALSAVILTVGVISMSIWVFKPVSTLDKLLMILVGGLLIISTFYNSFSSTRKWNKT